MTSPSPRSGRTTQHVDSPVVTGIRAIIADALDRAGVRWQAGYAPQKLDFTCPDLGIRIEVREEWNDMEIRRLQNHPQAIYIQGEAAAAAFAALIVDAGNR